MNWQLLATWHSVVYALFYSWPVCLPSSVLTSKKHMHFQQLMTTHWMYLSSLDGILRYIVEVLIVVIGCICGHWMASWGLVLGDVVGLYCNICGLWFWLVLGFHELVVINMWMMMNMWLVVVIYCDLWFTIMVVIYCEKMGWWLIYIWNACVDGMQKTKKN